MDTKHNQTKPNGTEARKARKKAEGRTLNNKKNGGGAPKQYHEKHRRPRRADRGAGGNRLPPRGAQGRKPRARQPQIGLQIISNW